MPNKRATQHQIGLSIRRNGVRKVVPTKLQLPAANASRKRGRMPIRSNQAGSHSSDHAEPQLPPTSTHPARPNRRKNNSKGSGRRGNRVDLGGLTVISAQQLDPRGICTCACRPRGRGSTSSRGEEARWRNETVRSVAGGGGEPGRKVRTRSGEAALP